MLDLDCVQQFMNAATRDQFGKGISRNCAAAFLAGTSHQDFLNGVTNNLARDAAGPADSWPVEAPPFPPVGVATCGMHGRLETTGQRFAELVASHQQTLAVGCARFVEFELLLIRAVVVEPVLRPPSLPFRLQCL